MTRTTSDSRCLLILPRGFYGFAGVLKRALEAQGYATTIANDEYPENIFGKIISKLGLPLSHRITRRVLSDRVLRGRSYELILVIKGRGLDACTAALLRQHGRVVVGYHFDAFGFDRGPLRWRSQLEWVYTFDYHDAQSEGLPLVELFTSLPPAPSKPARHYSVSAVMRNHSQRLAYLDKVLRALDDAGVQGERFIHIMEAHFFSFLSNFLRHPLLYWKYRRHISRQALPYDDYVNVIADSELTIDYAHPRQTGITIRCFEALSAGTRIITNNASVRLSPWFDPEHAIVLAQGDPARFLSDQLAALPPGPPQARRRSVDTFLHELINPAMVQRQPSTAPHPTKPTPTS
jgi:hypothetical protein